MAPVEQQTYRGDHSYERHREHEVKKTAAIAGVGRFTAGAAGIGAGVLSILGLAGFLPLWMTAISAIVLGGGLLLSEGAVASRLKQIPLQHEDVVKGLIGVEMLVGAGAVTLGILAMVGINPVLLSSCAAIVIGAGMLIAGAEEARIDRSLAYAGRSSERQAQSVLAGAGVEGLTGVAAITLGILSLIGIEPVTLNLVAFLAVGVGFMLGGGIEGASASMSARELH
ncbi:MAG: hypothetical protein KDD44_07430 [Bdellovibrionales bacterium]|nr:hypothetical protein [Bdellovibrionales bacterium]